MALPKLSRGEALQVIAVLTVGLTALSGALGLGPVTGLVAITGFLLVLPLTAILGDRLPWVASDAEAESETVNWTADREDGDDHAVARLRERYAAGEIDEAEFERRLEALLETQDHDETVADDPEFATELE
jgi:uncharacterized membrane protein